MKDSSAPIICKTVKRYYFNGKGYCTKRAALLAKARMMMMEMVLGPRDQYGLLKWTIENEGHDAVAMDVQFAKFFPHEGGTHAQGCKDKRPLSEEKHCRISEYYGPGYTTQFCFRSCKTAQQRWINDKADELDKEL